jgi:hypothetical protein
LQLLLLLLLLLLRLLLLLLQALPVRTRSELLGECSCSICGVSWCCCMRKLHRSTAPSHSLKPPAQQQYTQRCRWTGVHDASTYEVLMQYLAAGTAPCAPSCTCCQTGNNFCALQLLLLLLSSQGVCAYLHICVALGRWLVAQAATVLLLPVRWSPCPAVRQHTEYYGVQL